MMNLVCKLIAEEAVEGRLTDRTHTWHHAFDCRDGRPKPFLFRQNEGKPNELRQLNEPDRVCLQLLVFSG